MFFTWVIRSSIKRSNDIGASTPPWGNPVNVLKVSLSIYALVWASSIANPLVRCWDSVELLSLLSSIALFTLSNAFSKSMNSMNWSLRVAIGCLSFLSSYISRFIRLQCSSKSVMLCPVLLLALNPLCSVVRSILSLNSLMILLYSIFQIAWLWQVWLIWCVFLPLVGMLCLSWKSLWLVRWLCNPAFHQLLAICWTLLLYSLRLCRRHLPI